MNKPTWPPSPYLQNLDPAAAPPSARSYALAAARLTMRGALWAAWLWSPLWAWLYYDRPLWMTDALNDPIGPLGHWLVISVVTPWLVGILSAALYFVASFVRHLITRAVTAEAKRIETQRRSRTIAFEGARAQGGALSLPDDAPGALSIAEEVSPYDNSAALEISARADATIEHIRGIIAAAHGETVVVDANAPRMPSPPPPPPVSH